MQEVKENEKQKNVPEVSMEAMVANEIIAFRQEIIPARISTLLERL